MDAVQTVTIVLRSKASTALKEEDEQDCVGVVCAAPVLILCSSCAHFLQLLCSFCSTYRTTWRNLCGASYLNPSLYPCLPHVIVVDSLSRCNNPKGVPNICSKRRKGGLDEHKPYALSQAASSDGRHGGYILTQPQRTQLLRLHVYL